MRFLNVRTVVVFVLLCFGMGARADNIVRISSAQGSAGDEVTISISLDNSDAVSSMQMSIPLNSNLSLVEGSGQLGSRCGNHSMSIGIKDNVLNVMLFSMSMTAFSNQSGEVGSFKLKLGKMPTQLTLQASKTILTGTDGKEVAGSCQSGNVTIYCALARYDAETIDFGRVPIKSTYTRGLTVTNAGNADLVISGLQFSESSLLSSNTSFPITVSPGTTTQLNITYAPTGRGTMSEQVKVLCNSISKLNTIALKALPYAVNELHIQPVAGISDEEVTIVMTMNNMDDINGLQVDFDLPDQLMFVDGSFALSSRKTDHVATATCKDNHVSMAAYSATNAAFTGNDGEIGSFRVKLVGRNSVELTPTKTMLTALIDSKVENVVSDVYGAQVTISSPTIYTDSKLDFGTVIMPETCEKKITVWNSGNAPLTISKVVFNQEHFNVKETLPLTIEQYRSKDLTIVYNGQKQTSLSCTMSIYSNDPEQRLRNVTVDGRLLANSLSIATPDVYCGNDLVINISSTTYDEITGLQFDVEYPANYFKGTDNNYTLKSQASGMSVSYSQISSSTLRYVCYYLNGGNISNGSGPLMTIKLKPSKANIPEGTYSVALKNIRLVTKDATDSYIGQDLSSSFQITAVIPGDVNGDGTVDIADAVCIVNHVVGKATPVFIEAAADVNDDGDIDIADAVKIVNIIVGK